ncbi:MAG: GtrA family protein [Bacteroidetes bacterium]|nr:MAG: GtrA family protein [Bacteroidota bacterium]
MKTIAENIGLFIIRILDIFYPLFKKALPYETYKYAATGGVNMALDIFLYYIFYHYVVNESIVELGFTAMSPHIAAFIFVFPITFTTGFLLAKYVTFTDSRIKGKMQLSRYAISVGGSIVLHYFLLKLFVETLDFWPLPGKIVTVSVVVIYSFLVQKFFTFRTGKKQLSS